MELNGGIFDAVGLNDAKKVGDPKLAERAPLVVPPSLDRLPPPGETPAPTEIAGIKDPDASKGGIAGRAQKPSRPSTAR